MDYLQSMLVREYDIIFLIMRNIVYNDKTTVKAQNGDCVMKMEFIIDEEKCQIEGFNRQDCLNVIRKHFDKFNMRRTIKEIQEGVFEGYEEDRNAFGSTFCLTNTNWFLKVIKGWNWYVDGDKINCLEKHYMVSEKNKIFD